MVILHLQTISGRNSRVRERGPGNETGLEVYEDIGKTTNDIPSWDPSWKIESTDRINDITPWDLTMTRAPVEETTNETEREPVYIIPIEASTKKEGTTDVSTMNVSYIIVGVVIVAIVLIAVVILIIKFKKKSNLGSSEDQGN